MPTKKLRQYILYNLGIWFGTALAAMLLIVAVRQYGTEMTARSEAERLLAEAKALLQGNAPFECQNAIEQAVRVYPPIAVQVTEDFRGQLLGLPVVHARVRKLLAASPEQFPPHTRALLDILNSPAPVAAQALAGLDGSAANADLHLWRARFDLDQGDIPAAAKAFSAYWQSQPERRQTLRRDISGSREPEPAAYAAIARRLFHAGLWNETFVMVEQARKRGIERPSFGYFDGVKLEMLQKPEEAAAAYERVLAITLDYRPAQLALARLKSALPEVEG
jgi:hypothetical protein